LTGGWHVAGSIMNPIKGEQLLTQLNWRYATKQFDPGRKISPEDWAVLESALILSPSSYGLQPWKFIVITDRKTREKLFPATWRQDQVLDFAFFRVCREHENDRGTRRQTYHAHR
jgi:nitroreductase